MTMRSFVLIALLSASCAARLDGEDPVDPPQPCTSYGDCGSGRICVDNQCIPDHGPCAADSDCLDDTYCACPPDIKAPRCVCVPWGRKPRGDHDPTCSGEAFPPETFKNPVLKCQWPPAGQMPEWKEAAQTPMVMDLDKDGVPEIIFVTGARGNVHLIAISGKDCAVKFDIATGIGECTHLAVGDLDGDGYPEIVALAPGVAVFDHNGQLKARISEPATGNCGVDFPPALVNVDGTGPPEIVTGGQVSRYLAKPAPHIDLLWKAKAAGGTWGIISVAEDLDGDGRAEVLTGNQVFDGLTGAEKTPAIMKGLGPGYPAIGDFNGDGRADIVLVSSDIDKGQSLSIIDFGKNQFIMPPTVAPMGWGGPPTVADFDGDGKPEVATAGALYYYVYSPDCLATPKPGKCLGQDPGVLWQSRMRDRSSGSTGSSVFDFNGDKAAEVVYRDECWLRVYNGADGKKLFAAPVTSGTVIEMPVIADTDGDGHAEIVVSSDDVQGDRCSMDAGSATELGIPHGPPTYGVRIYQDPMNRWMPSRGVWNQHSYHITNINDDGSIPAVEMPNVGVFNNYRQNIQGGLAGNMPESDGTGAVVFPPDSGDCIKLWKLHANLCNRGAAPMPAAVPGTFYEGDPRGTSARAICTARSNAIIAPGKCALLTCDWNNPPPGAVDLWLRINDDGKGGHPLKECKTGNDLAHFASVACHGAPG